MHRNSTTWLDKLRATQRPPRSKQLATYILEFHALLGRAIVTLLHKQIVEEKMNTIIPNKLSFNFDLNDLPARASQVSLEALNLSGGIAACTWAHNHSHISYGSASGSENEIRSICNRICSELKLRNRGRGNLLLGAGYRLYPDCFCCAG